MDNEITFKRFEYICRELNPFAVQDASLSKYLSDDDVAWLVKFSEFHGLRGELLRDRRVSAQDIDWVRIFKPWERRYAFRTLQMVGEIAALARAFDAAGIEAVFFKGAVLGEQLYGGAQNREYEDIDVLVAPAFRQKASDAIARLGFQPIVRVQSMRKAFFDHAGQHMHHNPESGSTVDLHWRFVGCGPFPVTGQDVLQHRTILELGGSSVAVPSTEDLALILAGHGQKEGWASFGWALDFAKFAAFNANFDWEGAVARAQAQKCVRPMLVANLLVERLFKCTIDARILATAKGMPQIVAEVDAVVARYVTLIEREAEDDINSACRLCDTQSQRAKVLWSLAVTPTIGDFEAMPLRPPWWWAYRLIRPARIGWRKLRGRGRQTSAYWVSQALSAKAAPQSDKQ